MNLAKVFPDSTAYSERTREDEETLRQYKSHALVQELLRRGWELLPPHVKKIYVEPGTQVLSWSAWKAE